MRKYLWRLIEGIAVVVFSVIFLQLILHTPFLFGLLSFLFWQFVLDKYFRKRREQ